MSRTRRVDNIGMHAVTGPKRIYGKCPICKKNKPLYCVSKNGTACSACIKEFNLERYAPPLKQEGNPPPKVWTKKVRKRISHNF